MSGAVSQDLSDSSHNSEIAMFQNYGIMWSVWSPRKDDYKLAHKLGERKTPHVYLWVNGCIRHPDADDFRNGGRPEGCLVDRLRKRSGPPAWLLPPLKTPPWKHFWLSDSRIQDSLILIRTKMESTSSSCFQSDCWLCGTYSILETMKGCGSAHTETRENNTASKCFSRSLRSMES